MNYKQPFLHFLLKRENVVIKQKKQNEESGRSMVEMIAVLAIIGILSVAAVQGFQMAMDLFRANETIEELNRRALLCISQIQNKQKPSFEEMGYETELGYPIQVYELTEKQAGYFEFVMDKVPHGVCTQMLNKEWKDPALIRVNGIEYQGDSSICRNDMDPRMVYIFSAGSNANPEDLRIPCEKDSDCVGACGTCDNGVCKSECGEGTTCARTYDNTAFQSCCPNDKILNGMCCHHILHGECCRADGKCCPSDLPLMDRNGKCHSCSGKKPVNVSGNRIACNICDGKEGRQKRSLSGGACVVPCPDDKPLIDSSGNCHTCDEKMHISTVNSETCLGVCNGSDETLHMKRNDYFWPYALCLYPCPDNEIADVYRGNRPDPCKPCTQLNPIPMTFAGSTARYSCAKCDGSSPDKPLRKRIGFSNGESYCALDQCPEDQPMQNSSGYCISCSSQRSFYYFDESECTKCPGWVILGRQCAPGCPKGTHMDSETRKCVCDDPTFIQAESGYCYSCDDPAYRINVNGKIEECDKCQGKRVLKNFYPGIKGCVKICAEDEWYTGSGCKKCNDPKIYNMYTQNEHCQSCDGRNGRTKRLCATWECQACAIACAEDEVMAGSGRCHTCDDEEAFNVWLIRDRCSVSCQGQRYLDGDICRKCPENTYSPDSKICVSCPMDKSTLKREGDCRSCLGYWDLEQKACLESPDIINE